MSNSEIHISTGKPKTPEEADFAIFIDFKKGSGNPARVFSAADGLIRAFQRLDKTLCVSVDSNIQPILMLEDIEVGSLKIWLKNTLESTDDQAIKDIDWRPAIGKYLVRAKYVYIRWANKGDSGSLSELAAEIKSIAKESDVLHLPDYAPPSLHDLAGVARDIDGVREVLEEGDELKYLTQDGKDISFDLSVRWSDEELESFTIKETTLFENIQLILIVKKPDYLGSSQWEFRHGKKSIFASMEHKEWLHQFQNREFDIRPGDALKCLVTIEYSYGHDNELLKERHVITEVQQILQNQIWKQHDWIESE